MVASVYRPEEESKAIWVYLEHEANQFEAVSLELLGKGRQLADELGWKLAGLLIGYQVDALAEQAFQYGADQVWLVEHALLEDFSIEGFTHAAHQALLQAKPSVFLLGATPNGRDLAGRLAVRLRTGLNADCTDLGMDAQSGVLISEVSGFGGGVLALIQMREHRPQMATVRPGVFALPEARLAAEGELIRVPIDIEPRLIRTKVIESQQGKGVNLANTSVLVVGGRGMGGDFSLLFDLARLLGGEVGATRPPVDEGHIERERQVGQTGVVCRPKVALCCGVSGAFHFVVGIEKADTVIAINTDPQAPIFEYADYGVVGDVHQVLPALIAELRRATEVAHV